MSVMSMLPRGYMLLLPFPRMLDCLYIIYSIAQTIAQDPIRTYFEQAQRLNPQSAGPYQGLGDVYYQKKEWDKALEKYRAYLDRVEGEPEKYVVARVKALEGE